MRDKFTAGLPKEQAGEIRNRLREIKNAENRREIE
jgi:hypothetical protein